ncbi:C-type lectin domain family 4 member E-like isoform X2 [Onychostruthus taczanowskii]|uniref:C-type lectin domain family 4 member E-like isoform X2 n=1 Tax=Onychostruthus taczanowskii TaxID=356909 RepID=UPI001B807EAB|nr:C-type lectin domain family 4 member E-like isoform X2 [Onychostruthus taczanowskii]
MPFSGHAPTLQYPHYEGPNIVLQYAPHQDIECPQIPRKNRGVKARSGPLLSSVLPLCHSSGQPSALQQQFSEWECDSAVPQGTDRGWTCCPKGWRRFQGSCYFLSTDKLSCDKSAQNCTGMGSQLVVINSKAEQEFLSEQTKQTPKRMNVYIGLFENKVGQWQWVDKTPYNVTAAFWREGEPSPDYDENCTVIYVPEPTFHNWNDVKATMLHHRICEAAAVFV